MSSWRLFPLWQIGVMMRKDNRPGLALGTRTGYLAVSTDFLEFRNLVDLEPVWPAPVENIQQFIVYLNRRGLVPGSIQDRLLALAFYAKINGYQDYSSGDHFRKMIKGWSKEKLKI